MKPTKKPTIAGAKALLRRIEKESIPALQKQHAHMASALMSNAPQPVAEWTQLLETIRARYRDDAKAATTLRHNIKGAFGSLLPVAERLIAEVADLQRKNLALCRQVIESERSRPAPIQQGFAHYQPASQDAREATP